MLDFLVKRLRRPWIFLLSLYSLTHFFLLLNTHLYWDDWPNMGMSAKATIQNGIQYGLPWVGYFYTWLHTFSHPAWVAHGLVFICFGLCTVLIYQVLNTFKSLSQSEAFLITAFASVLPYNNARVLLSAFQYTLPYLSFWAGWYLLTCHLNAKNPALKLTFRLLALGLFFVSFAAHSILVFYALVLVYIFWHSSSKIKLDFLALPLVFWVLKMVYFAPSGPTASYNKLTANGFLGALPKLVSSLGHSLFDMGNLFFGLSWLAVLALGWLLWKTLSAYLPKLSDIKTGHSPFQKTNFLWATLALVTAIFPYTVVGNVVSAHWGFKTRHELLLPLGVAFLIVFLLKKFCPTPGFLIKISAVLLACFVLIQWQSYLQFERDGIKQKAIIENLKMHPELLQAKTLVFSDQVSFLNVNRRQLRSYDYQGFLTQALGSYLGQIVSEQDADGYDFYASQKAGADSLKITIMPCQLAFYLEPDLILNLKLKEWFSPKAYADQIKKLVRLSVGPV